MFTTTPILSEMHYNLRLQDLISAQRVTPAPPHYHLTDATQDLFQFMPQLLGKRAQEESWVAYLRQGRLCHLDPVAQGDLAYTPLTTFAIHQRALCYQADGFYLFHNHPGGRPQHSLEDQAATQRLMAIDRLMRFNFLGHLVVTPAGCYWPNGQLVVSGQSAVTAATPTSRWLDCQLDEKLQPTFAAHGPLHSAKAIATWADFAVTHHGEFFDTPGSQRVICYFNYDLTPVAWLPVRGDLTNEHVQQAISAGALLTNTQLLGQIIFAGLNVSPTQLDQQLHAAVQEPVDWLNLLDLHLIDTIVLSTDYPANTVTYAACSERYVIP